MRLRYQLDGISCDHCVQKILGMVKEIPAATDVDLSFERSQLELNLDESQLSRDDLAKQLGDLGYPVLQIKEI